MNLNRAILFYMRYFFVHFTNADVVFFYRHIFFGARSIDGAMLVRISVTHCADFVIVKLVDIFIFGVHNYCSKAVII